jgi:hypothetical protein
LMSTELTTMRTAKVTILAAMPFIRHMKRPMMAAMAVVTATAARIAKGTGNWMLASPSGACGMTVSFTAAGADRMAVTYAAIPTNPMWPKDSTPEWPTNTCVPTTMMAFSTITVAMCRMDTPPVP